MKFDTIIAGGGIAGLICGIVLQKQGLRSLIISTGQSSLSFHSGSFDLMSYMPDGSFASDATKAVEAIVEIKPQHPYAKIGIEQVVRLADYAKSILTEAGINTTGSAGANHFRMSPIGIALPTWLTLSDYISFTSLKSKPYERILLVEVEGFTDFNAMTIKNRLSKSGADIETVTLKLSALDGLRRNPTEMRSSNIAKILDKREAWKDEIATLKKSASDYDIIVMPACISNRDTMRYLSETTGKPIKLAATLPPSVSGFDTESRLRKYFTLCGGTFMLGDSVTAPFMENGKIRGVYTRDHGDIPFQADNIVVATGGFFSSGLTSTFNSIYEPVFNLDVIYPKGRKNWYGEHFFDKHPYMETGVICDEHFHPAISNKTLPNVYVCGSILAGFAPVKEGSGSGVAMLSALRVAQLISEDKNSPKL